MYSSGSTSKACRAVPLAFGLALMLSGCAGGGRRVVRPTFSRGYARLDALVRFHPGWPGVARYDAALARLADVSRRAPATAPPDTGLAGLPPVSEGALAAPALALAGESRRLEMIQRTQVSRLRGRQAQNRSRQIALESQAWERQAASDYARAVERAQSTYTQRLAALVLDADAQRLNLVLQIKALQRIVAGWNASTPPTPELNQAKADLLQKQSKLGRLDQSRRQLLARAGVERDAALAAARQTRAASVSGLAGSEESRLRAQDEQQVSALGSRLAAQGDALLREEQSLSVAPVPPAGGLGAQALPSGPVPATAAPGAAHSFRLARTQLQGERDRWIAFLYRDTQAAALDAATRQHWIVTFGRPAPGERDLTAPLAQALTARVWKT